MISEASLSDRDQFVLLKKIASYLQKRNRGSNDPDFIKQFEEGHCSGLSSLWLYARWLQTQPKTSDKPRDDYDWFKKTTDLIFNWEEPDKDIADQLNNLMKKHESSGKPYEEFMNRELAVLEKSNSGKAKKLKELMDAEEQIERFISHVNFFQDIVYYLPIQQGSLDKSLLDTKGRELKKEYTIASVFTLDQFKKLLKTRGIIQERKLILVSSHTHDTALFKEGENYHYFDPSSKTGEVKSTSSDKVAELIFHANFSDDNGHIDKNMSFPIGFRMFSFDEELGNYPRQEDVLNDFDLDSNTNEVYAEVFSGLHAAAMIGCVESAKFFMEKKGANVNAVDKNGNTPLMEAAVEGYHQVVVHLLDKGANPGMKNMDGDTALTLAEKNGHRKVAKMLQQALSESKKPGVGSDTTGITEGAEDSHPTL
ncbi:MAG: ankyrin [uncultured bacterium]|nr:MAG: ankyrin [uncultured bacterium]OGT09582.1 MAG: hypothetical protein A2V89_03715 [Gammaproteobacteria bacterium RBG_16_37_9]